uniref:Uncharacterized protein n=1 Tax=Rhizophora mucronata TaxID=61149 RepID=A0A2P2P3F9_RHIMU
MLYSVKFPKLNCGCFKSDHELLLFMDLRVW